MNAQSRIHEQTWMYWDAEEPKPRIHWVSGAGMTHWERRG